MFCNASAFVLGTGCPDIQVNLSFPTLAYCESEVSIYFEKPLQQYLVIPENQPSPEIAGDSVVKCIDIEPIVNVNVRSIYDISNITHFGANSDNARSINTFSVRKAVASGGSYVDGDCADGQYRLVLNFDIPCILDSWPRTVGVHNADGVSVGKLRFTHLSGCRITGAMDLDMACSGTIVVEKCPLDHIHYNLHKLSGTSAGMFRFHLGYSCDLNASLFWPMSTYSTHGLWVDVVDRNPDSTDKRHAKPNWFYATVLPAQPYFDMPHVRVAGNVSLPYFVSVVITGMTGISVHMLEPHGPRADRYRHVYEIYSLPIDMAGFTGQIGPTGQKGDTVTVFFGRTGPTGSAGPDGLPGSNGHDLTCIGVTGDRGPAIECPVSIVFPPDCTNPGGSSVMHYVGGAQLVFGSYARLRINSVDKHLVYVMDDGSWRLSSYVSMHTREITIPTTIYS